MAGGAILYDGQSADRHLVSIDAADGKLLMAGETIVPEVIDPALLTRESHDGSANHVRLGHRERDGWRLIIPEPVAPEIADLLPGGGRYGGWIDRVGLGKAAAAFAAVAAAVLLVGYTAPSWLAPLVPEQWEEDVGNALVGDLGSNRCKSDEAEAILAKMVAKLDTGSGDHDMAIQPAIIDIPIFNAAALPGGHIVIFDGALDDDISGDALAGVIAHEIAHVRKRHVAQALIREFGIGALVRLFGGDIGANAQQLVSLSYTRDNEHEADIEAIAMLDRANISPNDTGELFEDLSGMDSGGFSNFLNSHPQSSERAKDFAGAVVKGRNYSSAFTAAEMDVLRQACRTSKSGSQ